MKRFDTQRCGDFDGVVGAVLEPERLLGAESGAVAAVVEGDHAVVLTERPVAAEPVQVRRGRPTVEQHDRGRVRRGAEVAHHDRAATGELDEPCRWEDRGEDVELGVAAAAPPGSQSCSTRSTVTVSAPLGAS